LTPRPAEIRFRARGSAPSSPRTLALVALLAVVLAPAGRLRAQELHELDVALADLPVSSVKVEGASEADERLIRNNVRIAIGDPYDAAVVRGDVSALFALGRFAFVTAYATKVADGTVEVLFQVVTQPVVNEVQTIGNKALSDQELRAIIRQVPGGPRDQFLIERAERDIRALYREKGYYLTDVAVDEARLEQHGVLIFRIIEGPRVEVKVIEFAGAAAFSADQLGAEIKTKTHIPFLRAGVLDEEVIVADESALDAFYKDRGYLDVRIGHSIELSPDSREAKIVFRIDEGRQYFLRAVRAENLARPDEPLLVFSAEQLAAIVEMHPGDVYSRDRLRRSIDAVQEAYGLMGHLDARVIPYELRTGPGPDVDLLLAIDEGRFSKVGLVQISGNFLTRDKVIRSLLRVRPGRPYDTVALAESQDRLERSRLFGEVRVSVQEPDPETPEYRDLLVEVKERNTGSVNFGVAVGSDSGLFGEVSVQQNNFDVGDFPQSLEELIAGRAFRGGGQQFSMVVRPGNELFQYSLSLTEPHILDSEYAMSVGGALRQREYDEYDEDRLTGTIGLDRALGDVWRLGFRLRAEEVELSDIEPSAPVDVFQDMGPDTLTSVGTVLTRTTIETLTRPGAGSRLELALDWVGAMGGDFDFLRAQADWTAYLTVFEDFFGRRSTLRLDARSGYLFGGGRVPTYERFYLGGRSFRGFEFRTVSPKGIRADTGELGDDPVGGEWLAFVGAQYEFPLIEEIVTGVCFVDSGTVTNEPGFDDWRLSVGAGVRLYIRALGPVPIAFDFGFPLLMEEGDEERLFSFSAELPFN
jgi:outer membrane protein insertion porin family